MTILEIFEAIESKKQALLEAYGTGDISNNQDALNTTTNEVIDVVNTVNPMPTTYPPKGM